MPKNINDSENIVTAKDRNKVCLFLGLSMATFIYWIFGTYIDVYRYAAVGAVFEALWLPMFTAMVVLPFINLYIIYKKGYHRKLLVGLIFNALTVLMVFIL